MTIEKDAILHLQKTANMLDLDQKLQEQNTNSTLMLVPEGFKIQDLEAHMLLRDSYRFAFNTKSIKDFVEYSKEFDQEGAKCFVNSDSMSAKVIFDIGTEEAPAHQRNKAELQLDKTSPYKKILSIHGDHMYQKDASDFIEDFGEFMVIATSDGEAMTTAQAANAINKITIEGARSLTSEVGDMSNSMSAMEREEVKGASKFPSKITFTCVPFLGLDSREFTLKVSVLTGGDRPKLSFRIIQLEPQQEAIAEEFKENLVEKFDGRKLTTFIGTC